MSLSTEIPIGPRNSASRRQSYNTIRASPRSRIVCVCTLSSSIILNDLCFCSAVNRNTFSSPGMYGMSGGMYRPYGGANMINGLQPQATDKGKGKMRAEDFDIAFAQAAASYQT